MCMGEVRVALEGVSCTHKVCLLTVTYDCLYDCLKHRSPGAVDTRDWQCRAHNRCYGLGGLSCVGFTLRHPRKHTTHSGGLEVVCATARFPCNNTWALLDCAVLRCSGWHDAVCIAR